MKLLRSSVYVPNGSPGYFYYFSMMRSVSTVRREPWTYFINNTQLDMTASMLVDRLPELAEAMANAEIKRMRVWVRTVPEARNQGVCSGLWAGYPKGPGVAAVRLCLVTPRNLVETLTPHIYMLEG